MLRLDGWIPRPFSRIDIIGPARLFPYFPDTFFGMSRSRWFFFGGTTLALAYFTQASIHEFRRNRELRRKLASLRDELDEHLAGMDDLETNYFNVQTDLDMLEDERPTRDEEFKQELRKELEELRQELQGAWAKKRRLEREIEKTEEMTGLINYPSPEVGRRLKARFVGYRYNFI
jgi:hypothetical protein